MTDSVLDFDLVARSGHRASAAKLRCSGRRQHRGHFFLSCRTRTPTGFGPPVTALAASSGVHCGPQPGKRRASLALCRPDTWSTSFTVRGRGLVQHLLTQVLRCLFTPTRRLGCAKTAVVAPPVPPEGGFDAASKHNAGGLCALSKGHSPFGRRPLARVRPCGPHNPRYVSCPRQRTASAVRCGFATLLFPRPPWSSGQSGSHCVARSRFGLPPTRPPPRGSLKSKRPKPKPKRTGSVPSGKTLCLLARVRVAACSVRQGQALRVLRLRLRSLDSPARAADRKGQSSPTGEHTMNDPLPWPIERIIQVAHELKRTGTTAASTGEHIAAAFVLNRLDLLPADYPDATEAWQRLGTWQQYVHRIKRYHMHLIEGP